MSRILEAFIACYHERFLKQTPTFDATLLGFLKKLQYVLLDESHLPSAQLTYALEQLQIRSEEPMKVAITGQFSSGKSTFLNALLAKNILPTGITPVTSKVNYIRYGRCFLRFAFTIRTVVTSTTISRRSRVLPTNGRTSRTLRIWFYTHR